MVTAALNVLVVDGDPAFCERLQIMLAESPAGTMVIDCATSIAEATDKLTASSFDLCLLDYHLGRDSGFEVLQLGQPLNQRTAFIILAEYASKDWCYAALHHGAMDYLVKGGLDGFGLTKSMAFSLFRKSKEMDLQAIAMRDPLTGIGNRTLFAEQAETLIRLAQRTRGRIGVLFMDIDGLKPVNDRHGHEVGDKLLQMVSHRISERLRKSDITARMGGDEFAALLAGIDNRQTVTQVASAVTQAVAQPYAIDGRDIRIGISCGSALFPDDSTNIDDLVRLADHRMYDSKMRKKAVAARSEMAWLNSSPTK